MFGDLLERGFLDSLSNDVSSRIVINRGQYLPATQEVLRYCSSKSLIVSDVPLLAGDADLTNVQIRIYCDDPVRHARAITDKLYALSKWVKMSTSVPNEEMTIYYNTIPLVFVHIIKKHRNISLKNLIAPVDIGGVSYMSPEIELIDLYRTLYSLDMEDKWAKSVQYEKKLSDMMSAREKDNTLGGKKCNTCHSAHAVKIDQMRQSIIDDKCLDQCVIIGYWAVAIANKQPLPKDKLQVIVDNVDNAIKCIIDALGNYTQFNVTTTEQKLHTPKDFRTRRTTVYIQYPSIKSGKPMKKPFMDIFNSASFELIPFTRVNGHMIGNSYVLLRFFMIDLWVVRLIHKLNLIDKHILRKKIHNLVVVMNSIDRRRPDTQVYGVIVNDIICKKISGVSLKKHYPYYPAKDRH